MEQRHRRTGFWLCRKVGVGVDVKIHRMGKEINSGIYYTASTVPRTGKVRLLFWHTVEEPTALVGAHHRRNNRDYRWRVTRYKTIQQICESFPGSPITYMSPDIMCGLNLPTAAADPNLPAMQRPAAHPHPHNSDLRSRGVNDCVPCRQDLSPNLSSG